MIDLIQIFAEQHAINARRVESNKSIKSLMRLKMDAPPDVKIPWCFSSVGEKHSFLDRVLLLIAATPVQEIYLFFESWYVKQPSQGDHVENEETIKKIQASFDKVPIRERPDRGEGVLYYYENRSGEMAGGMAVIKTVGKRRILGAIEVDPDTKLYKSNMTHFFQQAQRAVNAAGAFRYN